jgi:signal transduction histidine kinase
LAKGRERRAVERFEAAAERQCQRVEREARLTLEVLDSLRLVPQLEDVGGMFEAVVRKGMVYQQRMLGAYGFVQALPAGYREKLAEAGRVFQESDGAGGFREAGEREAYFPLTWQTPPGGLGVPLDYDFGARAEERAAMGDIARDGVFALGGEAFGTDDGTRYLLAPIYLSGREALLREPEGYAVGLFQPRAVLERAGGEEASGLRMRLGPAGAEGGGGGEWPWSRRFDLANEEWVFEAAPAGGAGWREVGDAPWAVLVGGCALTLALAGALLDMGRRARRVERLVAERTRELAEANGRLREVMGERLKLEDRMLRLADREKARLGRDLHDSLGQKLTGALYLLAGYRRMAEEGFPSLEEDGETISATLKESLGQVRRMAKGLAPIELTATGLPDALKGLAEEASKLLGVEVEWAGEEPWPVPAEGVAEQLYLIAQEAVTNAAKHGGGRRVRVELRAGGEGEGVLTVEDDGKGLDADAERESGDDEGGNGLRIMRHRAEVFGGRLEFGRSAWGGAKVECVFPRRGEG